jgi:hypothetical protein
VVHSTLASTQLFISGKGNTSEKNKTISIFYFYFRPYINCHFCFYGLNQLQQTHGSDSTDKRKCIIKTHQFKPRS